MIAFVQGVLEAKGAASALINVGGIGLLLHVPTSTAAALGALGERVRLHTHLHFTEEVQALYGFAAEDELKMFRLLLSVGGIGPRTALSALSVLRPEQLARAIVSEDLAALSRVPGIGKKTAARIALELKPTLEKDWAVPPEAAAEAAPDAVAALVALGYAQAEARSTLARIENAQGLPLEEQVRQALQRLGRG